MRSDRRNMTRTSHYHASASHQGNFFLPSPSDGKCINLKARIAGSLTMFATLHQTVSGPKNQQMNGLPCRSIDCFMAGGWVAIARCCDTSGMAQQGSQGHISLARTYIDATPCPRPRSSHAHFLYSFLLSHQYYVLRMCQVVQVSWDE